eukprot:TRINITY_DN9307_c0_g2_i1.p1 TRINITY_DN9307_c0_g2~~TRINITY_DN9307_c0_g2_i1.p1  ORF type:complete len:1815 (+),score=426.11 TRINITY_DN9307_c0_g2_i1:83-5527(+)
MCNVRRRRRLRVHWLQANRWLRAAGPLLALLHCRPALTQLTLASCSALSDSFNLTGSFPSAGTLSGHVQGAPCPSVTDSVYAGGGKLLAACRSDGVVLCAGEEWVPDSGQAPAASACRPLGHLGCGDIGPVYDVSLGNDRTRIYTACGTAVAFCQWDDSAAAAGSCTVLSSATCPGDGEIKGIEALDSATLLLGCYATTVSNDSGVVVCPLASDGTLAGPCARQGDDPCGSLEKGLILNSALSASSGGLFAGCESNGAAYCSTLGSSAGPSGCGPVSGVPCSGGAAGAITFHSTQSAGVYAVSCQSDGFRVCLSASSGTASPTQGTATAAPATLAPSTAPTTQQPTAAPSAAAGIGTAAPTHPAVTEPPAGGQPSASPATEPPSSGAPATEAPATLAPSPQPTQSTVAHPELLWHMPLDGPFALESAQGSARRGAAALQANLGPGNWSSPSSHSVDWIPGVHLGAVLLTPAADAGVRGGDPDHGVQPRLTWMAWLMWPADAPTNPEANRTAAGQAVRYGHGLIVATSNGAVHCALTSGGEWMAVTAGQLEPGVWHHIQCVYSPYTPPTGYEYDYEDDAQFQLEAFIDFQLGNHEVVPGVQPSAAAPEGGLPTDGPAVIGSTGSPAGDGEWLDPAFFGAVDDARVYRAAVPAHRVAASACCVDHFTMVSTQRSSDPAGWPCAGVCLWNECAEPQACPPGSECADNYAESPSVAHDYHCDSNDTLRPTAPSGAPSLAPSPATSVAPSPGPSALPAPHGPSAPPTAPAASRTPTAGPALFIDHLGPPPPWAPWLPFGPKVRARDSPLRISALKVRAETAEDAQYTIDIPGASFRRELLPKRAAAKQGITESPYSSPPYISQMPPPGAAAPLDIAAALYNALSGFGTDEEAVFEGLYRVTGQEHWHLVQNAFREMFPESWGGDLKRALELDLTADELEHAKYILSQVGVEWGTALKVRTAMRDGWRPVATHAVEHGQGCRHIVPFDYAPDVELLVVTERCANSTPNGIAAVYKRRRQGFIVAAARADEQHGAQVRVRLSASGYRAPSDGERFIIQLMPALFSSLEEWARVCAPPSDLCAVAARIVAASTGLPQGDLREATTAGVYAGTAGVTAVSGGPGGVRAGGSMVRASLLQRQMLCPSEGPDELDLTLNPLQLAFSSGDYAAHRGALVGCLAVSAACTVLCALAYLMRGGDGSRVAVAASPAAGDRKVQRRSSVLPLTQDNGAAEDGPPHLPAAEKDAQDRDPGEVVRAIEGKELPDAPPQVAARGGGGDGDDGDDNDDNDDGGDFGEKQAQGEDKGEEEEEEPATLRVRVQGRETDFRWKSARLWAARDGRVLRDEDTHWVVLGPPPSPGRAVLMRSPPHGGRLPQRLRGWTRPGTSGWEHAAHRPVRIARPAEDLLLQAGAAWTLIPLMFLFGAVIVACGTLTLYDEDMPGWRSLGVIVFIPLGVGLLAYSLVGAHIAVSVADCVPKSDDPWPAGKPRTGLFKFFAPTLEWAPRERHPFAGLWAELHGMCYDGYHAKARYFLFFEVLCTLALGGLTVWQPPDYDGCISRAAGMFGVLCLLTLTLLGLRPYLAPYENVCEGLLAGTEAVIAGVTLAAMLDDGDEEHPAAQLAADLSVFLLFGVMAKFGLDQALFLYEKAMAWRQSAAEGGGFLGLLWRRYKADDPQSPRSDAAVGRAIAFAPSPISPGEQGDGAAQVRGEQRLSPPAQLDSPRPIPGSPLQCDQLRPYPLPGAGSPGLAKSPGGGSAPAWMSPRSSLSPAQSPGRGTRSHGIVAGGAVVSPVSPTRQAPPPTQRVSVDKPAAAAELTVDSDVTD